MFNIQSNLELDWNTCNRLTVYKQIINIKLDRNTW